VVGNEVHEEERGAGEEDFECGELFYTEDDDTGNAETNQQKSTFVYKRTQ
jgi:hypothetical protein